MKQKLILAAVLMWIAFPTACKTTSTTPPPLAPGYSNSADQTMGETLAAANAFYKRIQQNVQQGTMTLSANEKTAMNDLATALNIANGTYLAYHSGTATQAQAQTAINTVSQKQQAAAALGVK